MMCGDYFLLHTKGVFSIGIIYFIVIVFANTIGAISGMGGGVIIKPALDFLGYHTVAQISLYSCVAVLTMSIASTIKQAKNGKKINRTIISYLGAGSVVGGFLGTWLLNQLLLMFEDRLVMFVQIILTIGTLIFSLLYTAKKWIHFHFKATPIFFLCGVLLGFLSSLLGIGGGPINVSLFMLLFNISIRDATVYSICTIFFSQFTKFVSIFLRTGFIGYDLKLFLYIIPAAIIGGVLGAYINNKISLKNITTMFQLVILFVILLNLYNLYAIF